MVLSRWSFDSGWSLVFFIVFTNLDAVQWGYDNADINTGRNFLKSSDFTNALIFLLSPFFPIVPRLFLLFWMTRITEIVMILLASFDKKAFITNYFAKLGSTLSTSSISWQSGDFPGNILVFYHILNDSNLILYLNLTKLRN